jgi:hypothetical protein
MQVEDIIGIITIYTFGAAAVLFPLYVVIRSTINFAHARDGRGTIILKALVVLIVWGLLSLTFAFIPFMYVFEPPKGLDQAAANRRLTILTIVMTLIYIAVGLALGYWVRLQPGWKTLGKTGRVI